MAQLPRNPTNTNYQQPTKFQIVFPRITTVTYFCQRVNIPAISATPARQFTPFVDLYRPGDKLEYATLDIEFIVDEDMWNWEILQSWMRGYSFPCSFEEYKNMDRKSFYSMQHFSPPQYADAHLVVLSALNNPKIKVKFIDAFPVSLSEVQFNVGSSADETMKATAQFRYQLFNIDR